MDYLQYRNMDKKSALLIMGFKPYYKWITFNTAWKCKKHVIKLLSFKPYYKWITFNTQVNALYNIKLVYVLNLIINGLPSILDSANSCDNSDFLTVLNLIINGLPSIQLD